MKQVNGFRILAPKAPAVHMSSDSFNGAPLPASTPYSHPSHQHTIMLAHSTRHVDSGDDIQMLQILKLLHIFISTSSIPFAIFK